MAADWSRLPSDLIEKIACQLLLPDYLRFGAVCTSWRSITKGRRVCRANQLPWLVFFDDDVDEDSGRGSKSGFFDFTEKKHYHLDLPEVYGKRFCGSSYGWLTTIDEVSLEIHLLNPFTRAQIRLPDATIFPYHHELPSYLRHRYIAKTVTSSDPSLATANDFVVMALHGLMRILGFCKPGDNRWTTVGNPIPRMWIDDVIRYRRDFYAVNHRGKVYACDLGLEGGAGTHHPMATEVAPRLQRRGPEGYKIVRYLVESRGDLLQVLRHIDIHPPPTRTVKFEVFKLDQQKKEWVELKSLGDRVLFLGISSSISLQSIEFPGSKPNLIYFTNDDYKYSCRHLPPIADLGVFNLADGTIELYYRPTIYLAQSYAPIYLAQWYPPPPAIYSSQWYPPAIYSNQWPPIWVMPNPW